LIEKPSKHLAKAPYQSAVPSMSEGNITGVDTRALGVAVVALGGGRMRAADSIDPAVGLLDLRTLGDCIQVGQSLGVVHARTEAGLHNAIAAVQAAYTLGKSAASIKPMIAERIEGHVS
jgi:thymidine phosphorylase